MTRPLGARNSLALNAGRTSGDAPYSPDSNANLTCWMDAQEASTITDSSGEISSWSSRVGSASYSQTVAGNRPNNVTVNGLNMVEFDGGDHLQLTVGSAGLQPGSDDFTIAAVFRSTNTGRGCIWVMDNSAGVRWLLRNNLNGTDLEWSVDDNTTAFTVNATDADFSNDDIYAVICTREGTNIRLYYGTGLSFAESVDSPVAIGTYGSLNSANGRIGDYVSGGQAFEGDIGELLFFKEALSSDERGDLYTYLVSKWSL